MLRLNNCTPSQPLIDAMARRLVLSPSPPLASAEVLAACRELCVTQLARCTRRLC